MLKLTAFTSLRAVLRVTQVPLVLSDTSRVPHGAVPHPHHRDSGTHVLQPHSSAVHHPLREACCCWLRISLCRQRVSSLQLPGTLRQSPCTPSIRLTLTRRSPLLHSYSREHHANCQPCTSSIRLVGRHYSTRTPTSTSRFANLAHWHSFASWRSPRTLPSRHHKQAPRLVDS
jgi:hypothetical protein